MAKINKAKTEILNEIGLQILLEYENKNLRASGHFESTVNVIQQGGQPVLILPSYTRYITQGIGSIGGYNPWALEQWIKDKGILARDRKTGRFITHSQAAFMVAKKIRDSGTDIRQGKREGLYLIAAADRALKNKLPKLSDAIVHQI